MIEFRSVSYRYPDGPLALKDVSCRIEPGSFVAILGKNGAGKTTFVKCMNGLIRPTSGSVVVDGTEVSNRSVAEMARKVGLVFQNAENQLFSTSVSEELAFSLKNARVAPERIEVAIDETLTELNLHDLKDKSPFLLSGGQKKRVAFASLACMDPSVFIADEPTQGQDELQRKNIERILQAMNNKGKTVIVVTHDLDFVLRLATRVLIFQDGEILLDGTIEDIFKSKSMVEMEGLRSTQGLELKWLLKGAVVDGAGTLRLDEQAVVDLFVKTIQKVHHDVD